MSKERLAEIADGLIRQVHERDPGIAQFMYQFLRFRVLLAGESDRACALMAAAFLDEQLRLTIAAHMVQDRRIVDGLLGQRGALATFAARCDIAYCLGLIGKGIHGDLNRLRKIRNEFAHTAEPLDFDTPRIAARCHQFVHHIGIGDASPRQKFTRTMASLAIEISKSRFTARRPEGATDPDMDKFRATIREVGEALKDRGWADNPYL